jgi:cytochrome c
MIVFTACSKNEPHYDGYSLLKEKCASCHNLDMPPKTYDDEKAPPMMAVSFHVKDFMKVNSSSDKRPKFIDFFQDFVLHPSVEKSFCDKESLKSYGLMPSQEGNVNKAEIKAIAEYVFDYYDQEKFLTKMRKKAAFDALPKGEQLVIKKGCLTCHGKKEAKATAPSFIDIAQKDDAELVESIKHGSKGKYKGYEKIPMPSFDKHLNQKEIESILKWIRSL